MWSGPRVLRLNHYALVFQPFNLHNTIYYLCCILYAQEVLSVWNSTSLYKDKTSWTHVKGSSADKCYGPGPNSMKDTAKNSIQNKYVRYTYIRWQLRTCCTARYKEKRTFSTKKKSDLFLLTIKKQLTWTDPAPEISTHVRNSIELPSTIGTITELVDVFSKFFRESSWVPTRWTHIRIYRISRN